ncbi:MAG: hypothetical protein M3680_00255 [Myxococcota bacterium]|nr:hypothetical protein [Myxococcota bacterium]
MNVSGWKDEDKQGAHYRDYFPNLASYTVTNYQAGTDERGFQATSGEINLDLEAPLPAELSGRFDVVFNHTVLEHIYDCHRAFANLCQMSRDIVIVVLPFLQPYHHIEGTFDDYWRFTPLAVKRMFEVQQLTPLYISYNEDAFASVYVFAIGTKCPDKWRARFPKPVSVWSDDRRLPGQRSIVAGVRAALRVVRGK